MSDSKATFPRLVIFACSNDTHVRIFAPVAAELPQAHGVRAEMLSLDHYLAQDAGVEAERQGLPWQHLPCPAAWRGSYWKDGAVRRVAKRWAAARAFRRLIAEKGPCALVVGHDASVVEWPLVQLARARGVTTVLVQDGVRSWLEPRVIRPPAPKRLLWRLLNAAGCLTTPPNLSYGHGGCDRIAVYGEALRRAFIAEGVPSERIVVTGNPRLDGAASLTQEAARQEFGLPLEAKVAVLATQPFADQWVMSEEEEQALLEGVLWHYAALPSDMVLVLKLHPRESLDRYQARLGRWGLKGRFRLLREAESIRIAAASDVLISFHSTVLLEALALRRPIVVLELVRTVANLYAEAQVGPVVMEAAQLPEAVAQALAGGPWQQRAAAFVEDHLFRVDGQSARRVADVIAEAVGAGARTPSALPRRPSPSTGARGDCRSLARGPLGAAEGSDRARRAMHPYGGR